jgi:hypothetical protein
MMFLRTTSTAFLNSKKGTSFRRDLQQSFQFKGHRASLVNSPFSYYIELSAGYAFVNKTNAPSSMPFWRANDSIDYDKIAQHLFNGIGLIQAQYSFNGSGDSGDFNEDELQFPNALNMIYLILGVCWIAPIPIIVCTLEIPLQDSFNLVLGLKLGVEPELPPIPLNIRHITR